MNASKLLQISAISMWLAGVVLNCEASSFYFSEESRHKSESSLPVASFEDVSQNVETVNPELLDPNEGKRAVEKMGQQEDFSDLCKPLPRALADDWSSEISVANARSSFKEILPAFAVLKSRSTTISPDNGQNQRESLRTIDLGANKSVRRALPHLVVLGYFDGDTSKNAAAIRLARTSHIVGGGVMANSLPEEQVEFDFDAAAFAGLIAKNYDWLLLAAFLAMVSLVYTARFTFHRRRARVIRRVEYQALKSRRLKEARETFLENDQLLRLVSAGPKISL